MLILLTLSENLDGQNFSLRTSKEWATNEIISCAELEPGESTTYVLSADYREHCNDLQQAERNAFIQGRALLSQP